MALKLTTSYLEDSLEVFRYYKRLAERAMEQIPDDALFSALDGESNSIAIIVKHMAGNMRSRWTDFLTSDGEKPDRDRDSEFEYPPGLPNEPRAELLRMWEDGWRCLFSALEPLSEADLARTVLIRGEAHSVMQAINRQLAHYPHHIGQIVRSRYRETGHGISTKESLREKPAKGDGGPTRGRDQFHDTRTLPPSPTRVSASGMASPSPGARKRFSSRACWRVYISQ